MSRLVIISEKSAGRDEQPYNKIMDFFLKASLIPEPRISQSGGNVFRPFVAKQAAKPLCLRNVRDSRQESLKFFVEQGIVLCRVEIMFNE
ncbi:MAG: hypothetical protein ACLP9L_27305 [Thermoguttaceae bacterium]